MINRDRGNKMHARVRKSRTLTVDDNQKEGRNADESHQRPCKVRTEASDVLNS